MKDVVTVAISIVAVVISFASLWISLKQRNLEMQRSVRKQMSDLVIEIIKLLDNEDLSRQGEHPARERVPNRVQRATTLARQAVYLEKQEPDLVTDIEVFTIAQGLSMADDHDLADQYWRKAIESAKTDFMRVVAHRGYAEYLFWLGKIAEARKHYDMALHIMDDSTDSKRIVNAYTYMLWLANEAKSNFWDDAYQKYRRAKGLLSSVGSDQLKHSSLEQLEALHAKYIPAHGNGQGPVVRVDGPAPPTPQ